MVNTECPRLWARLAWCWSRLALQHSTNCWKLMGQLSGLTSWDGQNISQCQCVRYLRKRSTDARLPGCSYQIWLKLEHRRFFGHLYLSQLWFNGSASSTIYLQWVPAFSVMKALWFCFRLSTVDPTASSKRGRTCAVVFSSFPLFTVPLDSVVFPMYVLAI